MTVRCGLRVSSGSNLSKQMFFAFPWDFAMRIASFQALCTSVDSVADIMVSVCRGLHQVYKVRMSGVADMMRSTYLRGTRYAGTLKGVRAQ
jgi:hypothetical protein